jgi:phosphatidylserine/phosphatidylglycerophosphate/cardiolipin synthase-like enzyme
MLMNISILAAIFTGLLLLWRLVIDYVPMYPLNDLTRKTARSRNRDWTVHYVPLILAFLLSLSSNRLPAALGLLIVLLYGAVQTVTWWLPYVKGGTDVQKTRWDSLYGKTHRILPRISDHTVPDTSHVVTGLLTVLVLVFMAGHLWTGGSDSKAAAPVSGATSPAQPSPGKPTETPLVETAFTQAGQKPEQLLIRSIQSAKTSLDIAINAINNEEIVKAILQARIDGAEVRIITDRAESTGAAQAERLKSFLTAGIPVKENSRKGLMNLKMAVMDDHTGVTGSFNYTDNAINSNDELLVIIRDKATITQWKQQFDAMWNDAENFKDLKLGVVKK